MAEPLMIRGRPPRSTVVALLQAQGLPVSDITDEHLEHFFFIGSDGSPTGLVGLEFGARDVRIALAPGIGAYADRSRAVALRSRCNRRIDRRCRGIGRTERGSLAGICLDRSGLLVYGVNFVRQPRDYDRAVSQ